MTNTIVTCAINGDTRPPPRYPAELGFPITPVEICRVVGEVARAGASAVHIHARDAVTGASSRDPALYSEIVDRIRQSGVDIILNMTCGYGAHFAVDADNEITPAPGSDIIPAAERLVAIEQCRPDICSLDISTSNQVEDGNDYVYFNPAPTLRKMAAGLQRIGVKPELETFQAGDVLFGASLVEQGLIDGPPLFQFVLGVKWNAPANTRSMIHMVELLPPGAIWTAFGISRLQMPMAMQAAILGGNLRVGLEDNLYLSRGVFATNPQLVERAATIVGLAGRSVATPDEARAILSLPTQKTQAASSAQLSGMASKDSSTVTSGQHM